MEIDYAVQEYYKELQGLKKEVGSLKSNLCSLETEIHTTKPIYELGSTSRTKATEVYDEQEAITNVEKKLEKLKKNLDDVILGREAQKIIHSAGAPELRQASITDITIKLSEDEINVCLIILTFLLSFLIGSNL
ncbi:coiled-coil domain-containing protein 39-like [Senna tora]|uniref:Coiled-coil domain-containing protein 39-like n=1 Tax=Senna tora TaxID=362788 RepID=A0A834X9D3_9FABA|nr:coiled-coil domain-containing protein 39-like [Senna tora]